MSNNQEKGLKSKLNFFTKNLYNLNIANVIEKTSFNLSLNALNVIIAASISAALFPFLNLAVVLVGVGILAGLHFVKNSVLKKVRQSIEKKEEARKLDNMQNIVTKKSRKVKTFAHEKMISEKHKLVGETVQSPASEHKTQPAPTAQPEAKSETQPKTQPETQPKTQPKTQPEAQPEAQPKAQPETQSEAQPEAQPKTQPEAQSEAQPVPILVPVSTTQPAPMTKPKAQPESTPVPAYTTKPALTAEQIEWRNFWDAFSNYMRVSTDLQSLIKNKIDTEKYPEFNETFHLLDLLERLQHDYIYRISELKNKIPAEISQEAKDQLEQLFVEYIEAANKFIGIVKIRKPVLVQVALSRPLSTSSSPEPDDQTDPNTGIVRMHETDASKQEVHTDGTSGTLRIHEDGTSKAEPDANSASGTLRIHEIDASKQEEPDARTDIPLLTPSPEAASEAAPTDVATVEQRQATTAKAESETMQAQYIDAFGEYIDSTDKIMICLKNRISNAEIQKFLKDHQMSPEIQDFLKNDPSCTYLNITELREFFQKLRSEEATTLQNAFTFIQAKTSPTPSSDAIDAFISQVLVQNIEIITELGKIFKDVNSLSKLLKEHIVLANKLIEIFNISRKPEIDRRNRDRRNRTKPIKFKTDSSTSSTESSRRTQISPPSDDYSSSDTIVYHTPEASGTVRVTPDSREPS